MAMYLLRSTLTPPEEEGLLRNDDQLPPELVQVEQLDVDVIDVDLASLDLGEAEQTLEQAALARARPAHHAHLLPRPRLQGHAPQGPGQVLLVPHAHLNINICKFAA